MFSMKCWQIEPHRGLKALLPACKAPGFRAWMEAIARERFEYTHALSKVYCMMLTTLVGILLQGKTNLLM